jgi:hypothetical protein
MRQLLTMVAISSIFLFGIASTAAATAPSDNDSTTGKARIVESISVLAPPNCGSGNLCFWRDNNTSGGTNGPGELSGTNSNWGAFSHSSCQTHTWNNCASFAYNNGNNCNAVMWDGTGFTFGAEGALGIPRGVGVDLPSAAFNDVASSNSWVTPSWTTSSTCTGPNPF